MVVRTCVLLLSPLLLGAVACRSTPTADAGAADVARTPDAATKPVTTPEQVAPTTDDDASPAHVLRLPDDPHAWVFGLVWHDDRWAIGVAYTDTRDEVELRPVSATGVAVPSHTLRMGDFPLALVEGDGSAPPWVIVEQDDPESGPRGVFVAHGFDTHEHVALALPKGDPGMRQSSVRHDWKGGATPQGAATYTTSIVRPLTKAERDRVRHGRRHHDSVSAFVTLAETARHFGGGTASIETARFKNDGKRDIGWREVAIGEGTWVGVHWISDPVKPGADRPTWNVDLHWFDIGTTRERAKQRIAAPAGSSGQVVMAADGATYLVSDGTDPFGSESKLVVSAFDAGGKHLGDRGLPVSGWIADSMTSVTCEGRTWLAIDPYVGGVEALDVVALSPEGALEAKRLWRQNDPQASGAAGSRPGRVLFAACGPGRVGLAMQLAVATGHKQDPASGDDGTAPAVLLAEWGND